VEAWTGSWRRPWARSPTRQRAGPSARLCGGLTDAGHSGSPVDASFGLDQQARIDYAYNALDKVTVEAKRLLEAFYGGAPRYSYMLGCSNGAGRR
jgi:feruloyl esterase